MKMLNLGCGHRFNPDWVNVDFYKTGECVFPHNLLAGIPYMENEFDVVYHSHLLEHFPKADGINFIEECHRVMKPGGIIRIAVPNLEEIIINYLKNLKGALAGDSDSAYDYEWTMLEMYDQVVRNTSGGEMARYLSQDNVPNEKFVYSRIGEEGRAIHEKYLQSKLVPVSENGNRIRLSKKFVSKLFSPSFYKSKLKRFLFTDEIRKQKEMETFTLLGRFRSGGEIHQWMYDWYSLSKLLKESGFFEIKVVTAFESRIPEWNKYELDVKDGVVLKPDSLFMEAAKPL